VKPKEQRANEAKAACKAKRENLKRIQEELQSLVHTLEEMQADLAAKEQRKNELEREINNCRTQVLRQKPCWKTGGEKSRWIETIAELQKAYENIVGDTLVAAGIIAYWGVFPAKYRTQL
jgi:dynein heavy chain